MATTYPTYEQAAAKTCFGGGVFRHYKQVLLTYGGIMHRSPWRHRDVGRIFMSIPCIMHAPDIAKKCLQIQGPTDAGSYRCRVCLSGFDMG